VTGFELGSFVKDNFDAPHVTAEGTRSDTAQSMEEHITALWPLLTRPADMVDPRSSLIPLPGPYVVPGGRFREVYYWDSYFTMLGLIQDGRTDLVKNMLDNFAYLIRTVGHIPNGNRTYYLSRSQPPYFAAMVGLYASATDSMQATRYLEAMELEHAFWMAGADSVARGTAARRVVRLRDGSLLNRYWDDKPEPRPESYREDFELVQRVPAAQREALSLSTANDRAACSAALSAPSDSGSSPAASPTPFPSRMSAWRLRHSLRPRFRHPLSPRCLCSPDSGAKPPAPSLIRSLRSQGRGAQSQHNPLRLLYFFVSQTH